MAEAKRRGYGEDGIYFDHRGDCRDSAHHKTCTGRWRGVVSLGYAADGKRIRKKVSGQTRTEVKALHAELDAGVRTVQALQLAQQTGIQDLAMIAFDGLAEALDAAGNDRAVLQACYGGHEQTRQRGGANYGAWLLCRAVFNLIASGHTEEAAQILDTALRVRPSGILDMYQQLGAALLATLRGDFDVGRASIERCRQAAPELLPFGRR